MYIAPAYLRKGDKVVLISTARKVQLEQVQYAIEEFERWGLKVELGKTLYLESDQFAGNDAERLNDLQWALDHPEFKAIFCVRGGYGTTRIIDQIDFKGILKYPKWVVGYSDITAIQCSLLNQGMMSIHGAMPFEFSKTDARNSIESVKNAIFGEPITYECTPHVLNKQGRAEGIVVGGNLTMLHTLIGTSSDIKTNGTILFIEDLDEYLYHIDRMMYHLDRAGKLSSLAALVVGHFSDMKDNAIPFGKESYQIISDIVNKYNYPVCFGFPVGHKFDNLAMICGRKAQININPSKTELRFI